MHYVYFLWSEKLQKIYIGQTANVIVRFRQHNAGLQRYTQKGAPWKFVALVPFETAIEARKEERRLKSAKNRDYIRWYIQERGRPLNAQGG